MVKQLRVTSHPDLIVGLETSDDAGVFRLSDTTALIQTLDFLTPVTDSPYDFGQIAAANSLSDVYAMGGKPLTAMNIVCFPGGVLDESILVETLQGGLDKIHEAGATLVGGHSVDDPEFKYGLSVTGVVHPQKVLANSGACPGDRLILTKPVGTGILATAVKAKLADAACLARMVGTMATLNRYACEIMLDYRVHACTDVTGFGLAGHLLEMAHGSKTAITLEAAHVPVIEGALDFAMMGMVPEGAFRNRTFFAPGMDLAPGLDSLIRDLIFDPQTSGGLIIALPGKDADECLSRMVDNGIPAALIGEVTEKSSCGIVRVR